MKNLKKGDTVVMRNCGEAEFEKYKDKEWICSEDSFLNGSKNEVVFLEGFSGSFSCKYLNKIMFVTNRGSSIYELIDKEEVLSETDKTLNVCYRKTNGDIYEKRKYKTSSHEKYFNTLEEAKEEIRAIIKDKNDQARRILQEIADLDARLSNY